MFMIFTIFLLDYSLNTYSFDFFFQAEDGIRYYKVTGVQTCALPISSFCLFVSGMGSPPPANLFHWHSRRKESERQASFFLRVAFTAPFRAKSESDIQTFDGSFSESLGLCDFRRGRGHLGRPFSASVLYNRIFWIPTDQVAWRYLGSPPICAKHYAGHPRFYDVSLPFWYRHRHWADLSSQLGAHLHSDLGRHVGLFQRHWDSDCIPDADSSNSERPRFARIRHASGPLDFPCHLRHASSDRYLVAHSLQPQNRQGTVCGRDRFRRSICAAEACLPSPYRRARLVLCLFDFEPALSSLSSIPCAGAGLRAGSSRKSGRDSFDTQLPCPFRLWRRALKTQAMELLSDDRSPGLLGCEYGCEHAEPKLQRRGGLFPEGNAGFAPSAGNTILARRLRPSLWLDGPCDHRPNP